MAHTTCTGQEHKTHVLLVDESQAFLRAATDLLERQCELVVVCAANEQDALRQIQALQPHVVLVGLDTPDLTGLKLVSRLRVTTPDVAIIALTMLDGDAYRQAALSAGADAVVAKGHLGSDLIPAIRRLLRDRQGGLG